MAGLFGWQKCQRDFGEAAFFGPETRPESGIDDRFDCSRIGCVGEFLFITPAGFGDVARKMCLDYRGHGSSGLVSWFADHMNFSHRLPPKSA